MLITYIISILVVYCIVHAMTTPWGDKPLFMLKKVRHNQLYLSLRSMVQCRRMRMRLTTITLRVKNLTPHKHTYIHTSVHIKPPCIRGSPRYYYGYICVTTITYSGMQRGRAIYVYKVGLHRSLACRATETAVCKNYIHELCGKRATGSPGSSTIKKLFFLHVFLLEHSYLSPWPVFLIQ